MAEEYGKDLCVHDYRVTKIITQEAAVGELLVFSREPCNTHAVAVEKNGIVVRHIPRKVACVWIQKTVDMFQIAQQSHIHVVWIHVNEN